MKGKKSAPDEVPAGTNPYPIYPDIDRPARPAKRGEVSEGELEQQVDIVNPDPDSLDRG